MTKPETIPVPLSTLREFLRLATEGAAPRVVWNEARARMDESAMRRRGEIFHELIEELETLIPEPYRP